MFPGLVGPVLAGVATIFVPEVIAPEIPWGARCLAEKACEQALSVADKLYARRRKRTIEGKNRRIG
jgi:hypothetical protein